MLRRPVLLALVFAACSANNPESPTETPDASSSSSQPEATGSDAATADVTEVTVSGDASSYTFAVTLASPDTGCDQYANWWEVLDENGALLYRRILGHSHVDEQPFTRTGGPVAVQASDQVFVRAHMNPGGYGGAVFAGNAEAGFVSSATEPDADAGVEASAPQPDGCAF